mmetsp:Transcript_102392/g.173534  ORF Transcript_102392/g.173534 Transcript_102392/m.173534 type:complete len:81 (+) Transcript_102392:99-341(+)
MLTWGSVDRNRDKFGEKIHGPLLHPKVYQRQGWGDALAGSPSPTGAQQTHPHLLLGRREGGTKPKPAKKRTGLEALKAYN